MSTQEAISYWCDGDRRLIQAQAYRMTGIQPHDGPSLNAFIQVSPRTVTLPHDFISPEELRIISLIESMRTVEVVA